MNFRKTKGLVTGLLAVALSFTALGAAQAVVTTKASGTANVKVGVDFPLADLTGGTGCGNSCTWSTNLVENVSIVDDGNATDSSFTFNSSVLAQYQIVISGVKNDNPNFRAFETTWTVNVVPGTIVDVAVAAAPEFSTLVAALVAATPTMDLVAALNGEGPLTVFAPTNAAFAELPNGVLDALLLPENNALLTQILLYHVHAGAILSGDIEPGNSTVDTLDGTNTLAVNKTGDAITINNLHSVVAPNVLATNGVIHGIDSVLLPQCVDITPFIKPVITPPAPKKYTVKVTGFAYAKTGSLTVDNTRAAVVASYLGGLGLTATNSTYVVTGKELRKNTKVARSARVSVSYVNASGKTVTVTKRIYFTAKKSTLTKKSKASLKRITPSV